MQSWSYSYLACETVCWCAYSSYYINAKLIFSERKVPDCWKSAIAIPRVLKKAGLDYIFNNFRPVSNPPFVAKVVEQAVIGHLLTHGRIHALLPPVNQSSYRTFRSTETALVKVQSAFSWLPVRTTQRCRSAAAVHFYGCTALKRL